MRRTVSNTALACLVARQIDTRCVVDGYTVGQALQHVADVDHDGSASAVNSTDRPCVKHFQARCTGPDQQGDQVDVPCAPARTLGCRRR